MSSCEEVEEKARCFSKRPTKGPSVSAVHQGHQ